MKSLGKIFWGLVLIAVGIIYFGNNFNLWNFNIFFDGWWTLFIIIPSFYGLLKKEWISSILGIIIGLLLLLAAQNLIEWKDVGKAFIPALIIVIGLSFILGPKHKNITNKSGVTEYIGIFASNEQKVTGKFKGASIVSIFGGVELDLTDAEIKSDIVIDCVTIFGGVDLRLPDNVNLKSSGVPIFGGVENKYSSANNEKYPTIMINYVSIFAGIDVK